MTMHPSNPLTLRVDGIDIQERQRKDLGDITELQASIAELGMIQPIVVEMVQCDHKFHDGGDICVECGYSQNNKDDEPIPRLVAGRRRLECLLRLEKEFLYHGTTCDPDKPGFVFYNEQTDEKRMLVEFEEDVRRKARTWQEDVLAIAKIHKVRWLLNAQQGVEWGQKETGRLLGLSAAKMSYTLALADEMKREPDGAVAKSEGYTDALKLLFERTDSAISEEQKRRRDATIASVPAEENTAGLPLFTEQEAVEATVIQLSRMVYNSMFIETARDLAPGLADCAIVLGQTILMDWREIVRQLKPNSYIVTIQPPKGVGELKEMSILMPFPIIWNLLGLTPTEDWPFTQNVKLFFVYGKGNPKPFNPSPTCVFSSPESALDSLIEFLLRPTSAIGSTVLMPCGGPTTAIAKIGRFPLSFEPDKERFDNEVAALRSHYESTLPKVEFR